jgi:hypothetical protein
VKEKTRNQVRNGRPSSNDNSMAATTIGKARWEVVIASNPYLQSAAFFATEVVDPVQHGVAAMQSDTAMRQYMTNNSSMLFSTRIQSREVWNQSIWLD